MVDVLLLITTLVVAAILLAISFYVLVVFVHPDDKGWGTALYCKILVILSMALCWTQALMLPLDIANAQLPTDQQINMTVFWEITYYVTLGLLTVLLPYAIFFYETDPNKSYPRRLLTAFLYLLATLVISCVLLFVSWSFLKYVDLPITYISASAIQDDAAGPITAVTNTKVTESTLTTTCSFAVYIMAIMSLLGWVLLILFGGVGLYGLPIDLINQYRRRPRPRGSAQMKATKEAMIRAVDGLHKSATQLQEEYRSIKNNSEDPLFKRVGRKNAYDTKYNEFTNRYSLVAEEFEIFQLELSYKDSNPLKSLLTLASGIVFLITAMLWTYQIVLGYLPSSTLGQPLLPSLNNLFYLIQNSGVSFLATLFYAYLVLYLIWCILKGNIKFGLRIPCLFRLHPMKPNETWMNSFLVNMILILLASCAVTQFAANCFSYYSADAQIFQIYGVQVNYLRFYYWCYEKKIMPGLFLGWAIIVLVYMIFTCNKPAKHVEEIQRIRSQGAKPAARFKDHSEGQRLSDAAD